MKVTPMDIQQQQFKGKIFGGLDQNDVDTFLQLVAQEMEALVRENTELKDKVHKSELQVDELAVREANLRETMLAAQKISEEMKSNAEREANLVISEAEVKGDRIVADAENRLSQLNNQISEVRRQKLQFETALKSLIETHLKMLAMDE
jgi:cell division initiation protein